MDELVIINEMESMWGQNERGVCVYGSVELQGTLKLLPCQVKHAACSFEQTLELHGTESLRWSQVRHGAVRLIFWKYHTLIQFSLLQYRDKEPDKQAIHPVSIAGLFQLTQPDH